MDKEKFYLYIKRNLNLGDRVLDVGCGTGDFIKQLTKEMEVKGIGIDPYATQEEGEGYLIKRLPAEEIDALSKTFDLIFTFHSLHHFKDIMKFMQNVKKILSPKGILIIADWVYGTDTGVPERYFKPEEVEDMVLKTGLKIKEKLIEGGDTFIIKATL